MSLEKKTNNQIRLLEGGVRDSEKFKDVVSDRKTSLKEEIRSLKQTGVDPDLIEIVDDSELSPLDSVQSGISGTIRDRKTEIKRLKDVHVRESDRAREHTRSKPIRRERMRR